MPFKTNGRLISKLIRSFCQNGREALYHHN